jgi:hypothetical protein
MILQSGCHSSKGKAVRVVVKHEEATQGKSKGKVFPVLLQDSKNQK